MNRKFSWTVLLAILLVILSLSGCSSNTESNQDTKKETKTVEVTAKADNKTEQEKKQQPSVDTTKTAAQPAVSKVEQSAAQKTENGQIKQPAQKSPTAAKPANPPTATSKTIATTPAKPASTTTRSTTSSTTSTTTSTTAKATTNTATTKPPAVKPATIVPKPENTVILSIVGPNEASLSATKIKINDGDTIFSVLNHAKNDKIIIMDSTGSGSTAYIQGINNVYEFDYGPKSGWMFKLNNVSITKSVGVIKVKAGDHIEGYYTK